MDRFSQIDRVLGSVSGSEEFVMILCRSLGGLSLIDVNRFLQLDRDIRGIESGDSLCSRR